MAHRALPLLALACIGLSFGCVAQDQTVHRAAHDLVVVPDFYDFGTVAIGAEYELLLRLQNLGAGTATVGSVSLAGSGAPNFLLPASWSGDIAGGNSEDLTVVFRPQDPGIYEETLLISLDNDDQPIELSLRGQGVDAALVGFPLLLDFGPVPAGSEASRTLTLENITRVEAGIFGLGYHGQDDHFEAEPPTGFPDFPWEVPAESIVELSVVFSPSSDDSQEAEIVFLGEDGIDLGLTIDLRANLCEGSADSGWDADGDGYTACGGDCDDTDPASNPGGLEVADLADNDCDEIIDEGTEFYDDDGDTFTEVDGDCDDTEDSTFLGAVELADGKDNDCDGLVDEGTSADDADGDGYTMLGGDCDDGDALLHPGADEDGYAAVPGDGDGVDNDCDTIVDEGTTAFDDDTDGYCDSPLACVGGALPGDCNDLLAQVNPAATEVANGIDDDCNGTVDDGTEALDDDGDGYTEAGGDCDDSDGSISPAAIESPDGVDNNCDSVIDEGTSAWDDDGDCYCEVGPCAGTTDPGCAAPQPGDCNDSDSLLNPTAPEDAYAVSPGEGDGIDGNCNGTVDEGTTWFDDDGDGFSETGGDCNDDPVSGGANYSPAIWDPPGDGEDWNCDSVD